MKLSGKLLILGIALAIAFAIAVFAVPQPDTMPGDLGYPFKFLKENAQRSLLRDTMSRGTFDLELASVRLVEIEHEFSLHRGKRYVQLVECYERSLIRAANVSALAPLVLERSADFTVRFERMRDTIWDPPFQQLFEGARLNTVRAQRIALEHLEERDAPAAAAASLAIAWHHLGSARNAVQPLVADAELLRYQGWIEYHRFLRGKLLDMNVTGAVAAFDNVSIPILREQLTLVDELRAWDSVTISSSAKQVSLTSHKVLDEITARPAPRNDTSTVSNTTSNGEQIAQNTSVSLHPEPAIDEETKQEENPPRQLRRIDASLKANALTPSEIVVNLSEEIELSIRAEDKSYALTIPDLGIPSTILAKTAETTLRFNATQKGIYPLRCTSYCTANNYGTIRVR